MTPARERPPSPPREGAHDAGDADGGGPLAPANRRVSRRRPGARWATTPSGEVWTAAEVRTLARNRLIESRLTPNAISLTGLALNVAAAALVTQRLFLLAGVAFIVGSVMDTLDGRYSRMSGKGTPFGAFLDSTLDRVEEGIVLIAVAAHFARLGDSLAVAAVVVCVVGSFMVSYTRARAEALGVECKVGLATRPVRVVIISAGLLLANGASVVDVQLLEPAVYALAALSSLTVLQRVMHVRRALAPAAP